MHRQMESVCPASQVVSLASRQPGRHAGRQADRLAGWLASRQAVMCLCPTCFLFFFKKDELKDVNTRQHLVLVTDVRLYVWKCFLMFIL
jgi:hypothetical protein